MPRRGVPRSLPSTGGAGHRWRSGALATLLIVLALSPGAGPRAAWARRGGNSNRAGLLREVQPLIDKGVAALAARDFATASKSLGSAYRSAPVPEVLLQLARLAKAEGRTVDTYDLYRRYLADPTRIPDDAAARETEAILATPLPESGSLAIVGPPAALVLIDDRLVGVLPLPQPLLVAAGKHTLVLDQGGRRLDTPLTMRAGRLSEVRTGKSAGTLLINLLPALLVLDEWPGVGADNLRPFTDAIERAAIGQQLGVMPTAVALHQGAELQACLGTLPCQQQLAKRSGLDYVLRSRVVRQPAATVTPAPAPMATPAPTAISTSAPTATPAPTTTSAPAAISTSAPTGTSTLTKTSTPAPAPTGTSTPAKTPTSAMNLTSAKTSAATPAPAMAPTASWTIELVLIHVEVSAPASTVTATCAACTAEQAAGRYRDALTELLTRGLPRQFGTAQLTSEPTGAAVTLAGQPAGKTALHLTLWEGSYELTLTQPGYQPATPTLAITANTETPLSVALTPSELPAVAPPRLTPPGPPSLLRLPRPRWRLALGGTLLSTGAMVLSVAGAFRIIDQNPLYCFPGHPTAYSLGVCQYYYDTKDAAYGTLAFGLAFGIAGTVIMAIPGPRPK